MTDSSGKNFRVGAWLVEPDLCRISDGPEAVSLRPKVMDLLVFLAGKGKQVVSADDIIEALWPDTYVTSESVYFTINQLRKALGDHKTDPRYIETIAKRGYRLIAPVTPVDETASPAPNAAGNGRTGPHEAVQQAARRVPRLAAAALILALLGIAGMLAWQWPAENLQIAEPAFNAPKNSVAVLPFVNNSSDPEQEYFSDGISEEILNMLSQVENLKVAARTSTFRFKDRNADVAQIARQLRVATILEGSVRKSGNNVRVSVQLINAADGFHLWSETFERELDDVFAIQDEIATAIVEALKEHLGLDPPAEPPTARIATATEAYDLYLQGKYYLNAIISPDRTIPDMEAAYHARDKFRQAIDIAPDFAPAWSGLAHATHWVVTGQTLDPENEIFDEREKLNGHEAWEAIRGYVQRAYELGPNLAEVQYAKGLYTTAEELDIGLKHLNRAIEINPNMGEAHANLALTYQFMGEYRKAYEAADRAFRVDPLNPRAVARALYLYLYFGALDRLDEALAAAERVHTAGGYLTAEAFVYYELGQFERFPAIERRAEDLGPYKQNWTVSAANRIGKAYLALGLHDEAAPWLLGQYEDTYMMLDGRFDSAIAYLRPEAELRLEREADDGKRGPEWLFRRSKDVYASLMHAYLYAGRYEELVSFAGEMGLTPGRFPGLDHPPFASKPWMAPAQIYALQKLGRDDEAREWLTPLAAELEMRLAQGIDAGNHYFELARLRVLQGRKPEALAALNKAVDRGWRRWYYDLDPIIGELRTMPGYAALNSRYRRDMARMRQIVREEIYARLEKAGSQG